METLNFNYKTLLVKQDGAIVTITINSPKNCNALSETFRGELMDLVKKLDLDMSVSVVIITGVDKYFIAGGDLSDMVHMTKNQAYTLMKDTEELYKTIEASKNIFIAAVNGYALGGGSEFTLCCDMVIASENAKFGFPEISLGIYPTCGGTERLPKVVGMSKAKELIYTGNRINAEEALRIGLVSYVVPKDELLTKAEKLASDMVRNSRQALLLAKKSLNDTAHMQVEEAAEYCNILCASCYETYDQVERMSAFLEKRPPNVK